MKKSINAVAEAERIIEEYLAEMSFGLLEKEKKRPPVLAAIIALTGIGAALFSLGAWLWMG